MCTDTRAVSPEMYKFILRGQPHGGKPSHIHTYRHQDIKTLTIFTRHQLPENQAFDRATGELLDLADGDIQTQTKELVSKCSWTRIGWNLRRGIPVLEEVEIGIASVLHLVRDGLTSRARESGDEVRVAGRDGDLTQVLRDRGHVALRGRLGGNIGELGNIDLAITAEGVVGGLEIGLLGEEEDQAASLTSIRVRNVEVEDARDGWGHCTEQRSTDWGIGRGRVNRNDQVRPLIVARGVAAR